MPYLLTNIKTYKDFIIINNRESVDCVLARLNASPNFSSQTLYR